MVDEALSAGAVARRLGVAVTTLRTWHQRYGLGPSRHVPGHHRRYTAEDLARLEIMRRLTADGIGPAEAARWARLVPNPHEPGAPQTAPRRRRTGTPAAAGVPVLPLGRAGTAAHGLARAAVRLDQAGMRYALDQAIEADGVIDCWDRLIRPVLAGLGQRHASTGGLIEVEHLLSRCVTEALAAVPRPGPDAGPARILLACADEEQHTLPLEALAAALAEAGWPCRMLGARVPPAAMAGAVARTGPAVVVIWSHARSTADPRQLAAVLDNPRRPVLLVAAGPGWQREGLPLGVACPADLGQTVSLTVAVSAPESRHAAS
ncbi:MerR family transcriptional regulator [Plantactinospora sp. KBS50]|uniref:MerR family transcriptional regulator n=1 Tax=Plantactinospora sp. KBS50 TaxID=2024580 RepID=UPI000BAB05E7|nr:MerR family transcriptional regulator [Plantactinospora sp. KBS50]ASW53089.1 MerR family transcriptional regulator [Plantactinospora sp. KBS50]